MDGLHANGQLFATSISHEVCYRTAIPKDGAKKKMLMKASDDMFQVCCKCGVHVVKLHCGKQFEHTVYEWRAKKDLIVNDNY